MMKNINFRITKENLINADKIMERGVLLPVHHGMTDEMFDKLHSKVDMFLYKFI